MLRGSHLKSPRRSLSVAAILLSLPLLGACADDDFSLDGEGTEGETGETGDDEGVGGNASYDVRPSVQQVMVWNAEPGTVLELVDADENVVESATTDDQGSYIYREVDPGMGYTVRTSDGSESAGPFEVWSVENSLPDQSFYADQEITPGFGYITMRDGTQLSYYMVLPGPIEEGPYPTLINYSGYDPSQPGSPLDVGGLQLDQLCGDYPVLCDAPEHPSGIIGGVLEFATIGVNMRGTGCSGGAYDFFETLQLLDGYDIVEAVAAQDWVKGNKVGLAGLSYPGLSQLFVAGQQPPSLAAITPLSVIAEVNGTLVPGGILNNGFAINWASNVLDGAQPYGKGWEQGLVDAGDEICEENQKLHSQAIDVIQKAYDNPFYDPTVADPINLNLVVPDIDVPVFLSGQWQDEQTGPAFARLLHKFDNAPLKRFTVMNGVHPDGYGPQLLTEWFNFLSFYVDEKIPIVPLEIRALAPFLFEMQFGAATQLPDDRFEDYTDFATAKADYEAEETVRILWEMGANPARTDGFPWSSAETKFDQWPPETQVAQRWYLQADGSMGPDAPTETTSSSKFAYDNDRGQKTNLNPGGDPWDLLPDYDWAQPEAGKAVMWQSAPLTEDVAMAGFGSVDLYVQATSDDADIQVTLAEVRSDGKETFVQAGWLRASMRALASTATELMPEHTYFEADITPLPDGEWELVRVELMPFAHIFRAGSSLRLYVDTPGNTRAEWKFEIQQLPDGTEIMVAHEAAHASSIALPVITGVSGYPAEYPPCPSLRGQPCRDELPFTNTPG